MWKTKEIRCSSHSVLSVKAVMVTAYSVTGSRPDRTARVPSPSPTATDSLNHSAMYMKDHLSGVSGLVHSRSTLGGTGLATIGRRGGPGQAVDWSQTRPHLGEAMPSNL